MRSSLTKLVHRALRMKGLVYTNPETGKDLLSGPDKKINLCLYVIFHPIKAYRRIKKIRKEDYNDYTRTINNPIDSNPSSQSLYSQNGEQKAS